MHSKENMIETILDKQTVFEGDIFSAELWDVKLPNGVLAKREAVIHTGGVAAFALCENNMIPLVCQHRVVAGHMMWELPAGKIEEGEDPIHAIRRELEEEAGVRARDFEHLITFYPTPAYCTEIIPIYLAQNTQFTKQNLDENEFLQVNFFTLDQIKAMTLSGDITDAKTIIGIFLALNRLGQLR